MRSRTSSGIPMPVSATAISTQCGPSAFPFRRSPEAAWPRRAARGSRGRRRRASPAPRSAPGSRAPGGAGGRRRARAARATRRSTSCTAGGRTDSKICAMSREHGRDRDRLGLGAGAGRAKCRKSVISAFRRSVSRTTMFISAARFVGLVAPRRRRSSIWIEPEIAASGLRISCARSAASWPIAGQPLERRSSRLHLDHLRHVLEDHHVAAGLVVAGAQPRAGEAEVQILAAPIAMAAGAPCPARRCPPPRSRARARPESRRRASRPSTSAEWHR